MFENEIHLAHSLEQLLATLTMDMSYISTLTKGYSVRVLKINARRMFSAERFGGHEQALQAALEYRNSLYLDYGIKPIVPGEHRPRVNSRIENGKLSGISLEVDGGSAYFIAKYHEEGEHHRRRFSIRRLGYEDAFRAACSFKIANAKWDIDAQEISLMRPTLDQYLKMFKMTNDVPAPHVKK